jgi:hypothetical protein
VAAGSTAQAAAYNAWLTQKEQNASDSNTKRASLQEIADKHDVSHTMRRSEREISNGALTVSSEVVAKGRTETCRPD